MSVHTSASRIRLLSNALRLPSAARAVRLRIGLFLGALTAGLFGLLGPALAAPTGQPVAYALTPNNTITQIDTGNQQVLKTISLPGPGGYIVGAPDGKHLYVTGADPSTPNPNGLPGVVWVIDTQTFTIVARPWFDLFANGLVISNDGSRVYVSSGVGNFNNEVVAIDTGTNTAIATINDTAEGVDPSGDTALAIAPNGTRVYVPLPGGKTGQGGLNVISTTTNAFLPAPGILGNATVFWAAVSPDSAKLYVSANYEDAGGDPLSGSFIFNAATNAQLTATANFGGKLTTPSPTASILYGKTFSGGGVVVFNTQTDTLTTTIPVATLVKSLAVTPDGKQLYVSNSNANSIAIINTATNTVTTSLAVAGATGLTIVAAPPPFVETPPTVDLTVSPSVVPPGSSTTVAWTTSGATSCAASGAWSGAVGLSGTSLKSFPAPGNYTFTLTCTGAGGTSAASASLTVGTGSSFSISATDIPVNSNLVLSWQAFAGATDCHLTLSVGGVYNGQFDVALSGTQSILQDEAGSFSYALACTGPSGSQTVSKSFSVYAPGAPGYAALVLPNTVFGIGTPGTPPPNGGLGGSGYAFSGPDLQALPPDARVAFGQTVTLGTASKASGFSGQTIPLGSVPLTQVVYVAAAINGAQLNQKLVVTYGDGTKTTFTQGYSDWRLGNGPLAGEDGYDPVTHMSTESPIIVDHRVTPTGATQPAGWVLHKYRLPLDPTKVATSLQFPANRNVTIFAVNVTKVPTATAESLASKFNVTALATAGQASSGPRLASGYAYDASLVPNGFTALSQKFSIGPANQADAVSNATIALPGKTRQGLTVLATGLNGKQANQSFKVTYQDGSTTLFTQGVSDWNQPQNYPGEQLARNTAFRITPTGARQAGVWNLYAYTFQTDPNKQVVSLTLPNNRNVVVLAVNSLTK